MEHRITDTWHEKNNTGQMEYFALCECGEILKGNTAFHLHADSPETKTYTVTYVATQIVEADSPDEAIELAVEQHGEMPDGTWEIEESHDRLIVPRITLQDVWLELSDAMEDTGNQMAYALTWGDYVANEWVEYFDDLGEAFTALALLTDASNRGIDFAKIEGALRAARTFAMENEGGE